MAADGLWVYCVVPSGRVRPAGLTGVDGGEVVAVESDGLTAVASAVPLEEYGEQPLREHLNDLTWLERTARAHEGVIESVLAAGGAPVPLSMCTIYAGETAVRAMLDERAPQFADALARLEGSAEWGVKAVLDAARLEECVRRGSDEMRALATEIDGKPEGLAYIARKRLDARVRDEAGRVIDGAVRDAHARLDECAKDSVVLPAQNRQLSGHAGEMVLNAAYLVPDEHVVKVAEVVEDLEVQYAPLGLSFRLSGPWPAYNFAGRADRVLA